MLSSRVTARSSASGVAGEEGILGLERGYGVHGVGAADGVGRCFREAEEADLTLADEAGHGAHGVFDGRVGIDAVLVVEVDGVDIKALETGFAGGTDVVGLAVVAEELAGGRADVAELGGEEDLFATAGDGFADEGFVAAYAVDIGGIEKGCAEVEGVVDDGDAFGLFAGGVEVGHAHAAESDTIDFDAG